MTLDPSTASSSFPSLFIWNSPNFVGKNTHQNFMGWKCWMRALFVTLFVYESGLEFGMNGSQQWVSDVGTFGQVIVGIYRPGH